MGRRLNGFLRLSLNDGTILFLVILLDKTKALIGSVRVGSVHAELRPDPNST